jgi:tRNA(Ile)-lysidine synthase
MRRLPAVASAKAGLFRQARASAGKPGERWSALNSALHQQVRRTIRRHGLCPPGTRLLIGVSGGSDSVALALLLIDLAQHGDFGVAALAHFNHQLRPEAARDEQFCRDLAARLGRPITIESADVQSYAASTRQSIEEAARALRYDFLDRAAAGCGAGRIAVGHTEDDQAETYLIKLVRGAGLTGLGGIYPSRGRVIRPLLDVTRADLRAYLIAAGHTWVEDGTNADVSNPRNRIRHRVLPELDAAYGGAARAGIARAAAHARQDGQWLDELAAARYAELVTRVDSGVQVDARALSAEPVSLQRRVVLQAARGLAGGREIGFEHVESALDVLAGVASGVDIPGSRVELRQKFLVLIQQGVRP